LGGYVSGERNQGAEPDSEPPRRCPKHEDADDPPPCGACADARRANDAWNLAQRAAERDRANAEAVARREASQAGRQAIGACNLCDDEGYISGGTICHHDPSQADTNEAGMAKVRAALKGDR
jgi:hypothetical protein